MSLLIYKAVDSIKTKIGNSKHRVHLFEYHDTVHIILISSRFSNTTLKTDDKNIYNKMLAQKV